MIIIIGGWSTNKHDFLAATSGEWGSESGEWGSDSHDRHIIISQDRGAH